MNRARLLSALASLAALSLVAIPTVAHAGFTDDVNAGFSEALNSGNYFVALPLIYLVGLATALTPCVYPMILITVSVFGARTAKSKMEAAGLSTSFVLGMATLFTPLGVVAGLTGAAFGSWLASPFVVVPMAILFVVLATSMFGAFELNLPPALQNRLASVGGIGTKGAFALGFVSALIAAPCTGPGFIALLTWIGQTQNVMLGAGATFLYSVGLGTLFWLVGTFSIALPKSGRWMEYVKSVFGVVMCVMALYYLRDFIPGVHGFFSTDLFWLAIAAALIAAGLAAGAVHLDYHEPNTVVRARKTVGILLATVGGFVFSGWLVATPTVEATPGGLVWREDFQAAIDEAHANGRPYIVDFGASWCGACGELERNTFTDARVLEEGGRFVAVHIDLSPGVDSPDRRALLASYDQRGLPLVVLHDSEGNEVHRVVQFVEPDALLALMQDVH
jgi:thiol:disulfide interchange protein DsbD